MLFHLAPCLPPLPAPCLLLYTVSYIIVICCQLHPACYIITSNSLQKHVARHRSEWSKGAMEQELREALVAHIACRSPQLIFGKGNPKKNRVRDPNFYISLMSYNFSPDFIVLSNNLLILKDLTTIYFQIIRLSCPKAGQKARITFRNGNPVIE